MWSNRQERPSMAQAVISGDKYNGLEGTVYQHWTGILRWGGGLTHPFNPDPRVVVASRLVVW